MENKEKILFTSESVTEGHPDKICDAISDAILDALIAQDPMSRVACETATTTGLVLVMGEITSKANIDIQSIVRETIREIGYTRGKFGFDADTCAVITALDKQSADIAMGVDKALEQKENQMDEDELDSIGAGDQGIRYSQNARLQLIVEIQRFLGDIFAEMIAVIQIFHLLGDLNIMRSHDHHRIMPGQIGQKRRSRGHTLDGVSPAEDLINEQQRGTILIKHLHHAKQRLCFRHIITLAFHQIVARTDGGQHIKERCRIAVRHHRIECLCHHRTGSQGSEERAVTV